MTGYTVYDSFGGIISNWPTRKNAVAAARSLKAQGTIGHYVVKESNAQLVWSA